MSDKEQVALFDIRGTYTGAAKRTEAHAQGLRVGLVFIWSAWRDENALEHMLLQTRARPGDPYLGSLDAAAGGHIRAGETPRQAAEREFFEEVGIALQPDELIDLGQLPLQYAQRGVVRHAMQFFYLCNRPIELGETVFSEEVSAFVHVRLDDFDAIVNGRAAQITLRSGTPSHKPIPSGAPMLLQVMILRKRTALRILLDLKRYWKNYE